jgi:hypothetical protein
MNSIRPSLSVLLCSEGSFESLEQTISRLMEQTICSELELVLVGPKQEEPWWTAELQGRFHNVQLVFISSFRSMGEANALGVRHATSDVVAFSEDHCFPDPDWAESLVAAHRGDWAVVGPQFSNANPACAMSRADFLIGYSPWSGPLQSGEAQLLPGHNSSYKKSVLLNYGDSLGAWLEAETVLHYDLASKGYKLYLQAAARTTHVNFSRFSSWFGSQHLQGRIFASERCKGWSLGRRLFYAGASPLIPVIRLARIAGQYFSAPRSKMMFLRTLPHLALGLGLDGVGQFMGYAIGAGDTVERMAALELRRVDHITDSDREALFTRDPIRTKLGETAK